MKHTLFYILGLVMMIVSCEGPETERLSVSEIEEIIVGLERESLDEFARGNPEGYALHVSEDFTYFDNIAATPLVKGKSNFIEYIKTAFGELEPHTYEISNINVQSAGNTAILEFEYISTNLDGEVQPKWVTTVVYANNGTEWKSIHAHWTMIAESEE